MHSLFGLHFKTQVNVPPESDMNPNNWRTRIRRGPQAMSSEPRKAKLLARKKERISLSNAINQFDASYPIGDFLNHPMGIESVLNTRALRRFEQLGPNTYRCSLQKIQLLNFEVAPVLDLCVTPTNEDCIVEMMSCQCHENSYDSSMTEMSRQLGFKVLCRSLISPSSPVVEGFHDPKVTSSEGNEHSDCMVNGVTVLATLQFKGSEVLEQQNKRFSASMRNHIKWNKNCAEPFLDVDVKVVVILEVYTMPFLLLPNSAIETPGNLIMQALVDRLVPLLLQQLLQDYQSWVKAQSQVA